jgi:DNA repair protein RadC
VKTYDMGEMRRRIAGRDCGCHEPAQARAQAREIAGRVVTRRATRRGLREAQKPPEGVEPIILTAGRGSKCMPFLKVEKDAEKFAACNALAEKLGPIDTPKKAYQLLMDAIGDEVNEVFGLVTLDLHLRLKSIAETGRGEPSAVMAPMIPTLQAALIDGAHAVILHHVHPSGIEAEPSDADKETTEAFVEAFDTVGVILIDHLIVGGDIKKRSYFSFLEAGLLD